MGAGRQYGFRPMDRTGAYTGAAAGLDTPRVAPRLIGEEAINDLIRFSLIPSVIVPAIVPALESALMQMVPSVLGRAVASMGAESPSKGAPHTPSQPTAYEASATLTRLCSIRDQLDSLIESLGGPSGAAQRGASPPRATPPRATPASPATFSGFSPSVGATSTPAAARMGGVPVYGGPTTGVNRQRPLVARDPLADAPSGSVAAARPTSAPLGSAAGLGGAAAGRQKSKPASESGSERSRSSSRGRRRRGTKGSSSGGAPAAAEPARAPSTAGVGRSRSNPPNAAGPGPIDYFADAPPPQRSATVAADARLDTRLGGGGGGAGGGAGGGGVALLATAGAVPGAGGAGAGGAGAAQPGPVRELSRCASTLAMPHSSGDGLNTLGDGYSIVDGGEYDGGEYGGEYGEYDDVAPSLPGAPSESTASAAAAAAAAAAAVAAAPTATDPTVRARPERTMTTTPAPAARSGSQPGAAAAAADARAMSAPAAGGGGGAGGGASAAAAPAAATVAEPQQGEYDYYESGEYEEAAATAAASATAAAAGAVGPSVPPGDPSTWPSVLNDDAYMALLSTSAAKNPAAAVTDATDDELEQAANCFSLFDANRDGELSLAEFTELLRHVHAAEGEADVAAAQVQRIFGQADLNGDGSLDFNEFLRFHAMYISAPLAEIRRVKVRGLKAAPT